jgi:hypothetical protein
MESKFIPKGDSAHDMNAFGGQQMPAMIGVPGMIGVPVFVPG